MSSRSRAIDGVVARLEPRRLITGALTIIVVALAGWWLVRPPSTPIDATLAVATTARSSASRSASGNSPGATSVASGAGAPASGGRSGTSEMIVVHAAGAVVAPGVYKMPDGARVSDLIIAAGGPTADGDPNALNLAGELRDGDRIEVPILGQRPAIGASTGAGGPSAGSPDGAAPRVVDLNRATAEELDSLPGIGHATAAAIISFRDQHGPFGSVDDLLDVPGIGPAKLEAIREFVDV